MAENVFMSASQKAKAGMEKTARGAKTGQEAKGKEKVVNVRMPPELHRKAMEHRLETGESMNALMLRLLEEELG